MSTSPKHTLTNHHADMNLADCAVCGPSVRVKYRKHRNQWACWAVQGKRTSEYRERQRAYSKSYMRRARLEKYGLTVEQFEEMVVAQNGCCAICGTADERGLVVDHDHTDGRVRGLLCHACNVAIGFMKDDPERLLRAVQYLSNATPSA